MYKRNREKYNAYMRVYHLKRYYRLRGEAISSLGGKCKKCGSIDRLELDHINSKEKEIDVSKMLSVSLERFWNEVNKCQVLCRECHFEKTLTDCGRKKAKGTHGTISSYRYCKCNLCREANNKHSNAYRREKRRLKNSPHS